MNKVTQKGSKPVILTINGGSSSIKFSFYEVAKKLKKICSGEISRIGLADAEFSVTGLTAGKSKKQTVKAADYETAIKFLVDQLDILSGEHEIAAIGHRIVHGMQHTQPALINNKLLEDLKAIIPYDPDHLPNEIKLVETLQQHYKNILQYACFDTAFHEQMPAVAKQLPIPRRFVEKGIRRYGFHGLSYAYLMQEIEKRNGKKAAKGRIIIAHLGNGASLAAVYKGKSIDTSMGFTPAGGIPMSSRAGDLDPGVAWMMMKEENLSPTQFNHLINHECGLLGIAETGADMGNLLKLQKTDARAAEAVEFFCYQVKKWIGSFAAALGGLDMLVFAGGIGEHSPEIRARICKGLAFLGIAINEKNHHGNQVLISNPKTKVAVMVMHTDEEEMIAKIVYELIKNKKYKE